MCCISRNGKTRKPLCRALAAALVILGILSLRPPQVALARSTFPKSSANSSSVNGPLADCPIGQTFPGTEALSSIITLQMPFIAGETWAVGGDGSFGS